MSILFDLDGTLFDTVLDFIPAINELRIEIGLPSLPGSALPSIRIAVSYGIDSLVETGLGYKKEQKESAPLREALLKNYLKYLGHASKPFPGIESLLQILEEREIPWGIVTNKESYQTIPLLEKLGFKHRAACIVSGDTTPNPKPHPDPLLYACQQIGLTPQQCVYVGDAERDIIAGNAAGMTTIGALFGYIEDEEAAKKWGAHHYVYHADEILPWYEKWQLSSHP